MSHIATVLIADSQPSGHHAVRAASLNRKTTLVVSSPDQLRGKILDRDVEVRSVAERMKASVYEAIKEQIRFAQAFSGPEASELAERVVAAVTARLDTAHHEWQPGSVLAHAVLAELIGALDQNPGMRGRLNRDFLAQICDVVAATLPKQVSADSAEPFNVVRLGPRYGTVLLVDSLAHGPALVEALGLHIDSTVVVSAPRQLDDIALLDDVEVIDRTVAMSAALRLEIDEQLQRCKNNGFR
ncbi:hypothetical protein SAMN04488074_105126 [Lentzea albidocapillata subsp. violacea]|uniref:Uncharacterized protein n=1 Tax=Lentzea albidocapillata subsp. violacea TaxID=128104 RepID=A0A1G9AVZ0_9PSEU|nr:hypothetical protein [Lentzea albidocapillata]SDK31054.1 hypothetical protein SAMN04488074_105126 [Lentzea albidocapillata subsp. violacea]